MAQIDYEQAMQTLRSRLGTQYQGVEAEGRDDMANVLRNELGYSAHEAEAAIDAMINSGALRYHRSSNEDDRTDTTAAPAAGIAPAGVSGPGNAGYGGTPIMPLPIGEGYWQIGGGDEAESGRKGQVSPS